MNLTPVLDVIGTLIYAMQALTAVQGAFLVILVFRRIAQKRFGTPAASQEFLGEIRQRLKERNYDEAAQICDSPPYWSKASPQLILIALGNRALPLPKLKQLLGEKFERDVLADLEYRVAWINTVIKTAPMLGLLGTVVGMIAAFGKIAVSQKTGVDPTQLADDISFALFTTAIGLMIALPLVTALAAINVRIAKLQDSVQSDVGEFLDDFEATTRKA